MSKKGTRALASATLMSLVLTTALSAGPVKAAAGSVTRVGEADRYSTAAKVATSNWTTSDDVVLVSGEGYADAVSASALAKKLNAPILLTTAGSLNTDAKAALTSLQAKNVYIVGGNASVNASVRSDLKANYNLVELQGANRYETNVAVAKKLVELGVKADNVLLVGGEGFSDALSVAPVAAAKGQILLLGNNNADSMKSVIDFVKANSSKVTVVGTSNVISNDIYTAIGATDRVNGGASRFETNINVLNKFDTDLKADKLYVANASGNGYADALVASALAGKTASPLVLVDAEGTSATTAALNYIKGKATKTTDLNVIGGTGVVSDATVKAINETVNPTPSNNTGNTTVQSIEQISLNSFKVVYGTDVNDDTAEDVTNYKFDGAALTKDGAGSTTAATATLQDDNRTVIVTMTKAAEQHKSYVVSVKKGVLSIDKSKTIDAFDQTIEFADTTAPTLSSVTVKGNTKLKVRFSEAIQMPVNPTTKKLTNAALSKFKINGQSITSFGVDTDYTTASDSVTTGSTVWASGVDFYFASPLPTGNNTLKVSDGDVNAGVLVDAAGFRVAETTQDFSVDKNDTKPVVKEVQYDSDGTLWVRFDRPMDKKTATGTLSYYKVNDKSIVKGTTIAELKEGDCTVKISNIDTDVINTNSNVLYVDDNVKDAYGNKVDDDTRVTFTMVKDETKPTVVDVNMIDSETIRVRFSKDIDKTFAVQASNYKLKDSTGADISSHIKVIKPANTNILDTTTSGTINVNNISSDDVWDIKIYKNEGESVKLAGGTSTVTQNANDWRLTGSKYTLTIKSLADTTTNHNYMDEYTTTLSGGDNVSPKVTSSAYVVNNSDGKAVKAVVYFSEAMDSSSLSAIANYKFVNASGDTKDLPSTAKITVSSDDKSVTIEFPTSYVVSSANSVSGYDSDNIVNGIIAANVTDEAGNLVDSFSNRAAVVAGHPADIAVKSNSYRVVYDGDDILVKVQYDGSIDADTLTPDAFLVAGQKPDSVSIQGSDLVLRFGKDSTTTTTSKTFKDFGAGYTYNQSTLAASDTMKKVDVIKYAGVNAKYEVVSAAVTDVSGASLAIDHVDKVYDYQLAPQTTSDYWFATTNTAIMADFAATHTTASGDAVVVLSFDAELYGNSGIRPDDFRFTIAGQEAKASYVEVNNNNLVFIFKATDADAHAGSFTLGTDNVGVSLRNSTIDLSVAKDGNDGYAKYVPSTDDKVKTRLIDTK